MDCIKNMLNVNVKNLSGFQKIGYYSVYDTLIINDYF
jgi:hypothetical protein